jgi:hypothetical protein
MGEYLPVRALNRSQNIRINKERVRSHITSYVNLEDPVQKKEFSYHSAIGALVVVGPLRTTLPTTALNGLVPSAVSPATEKKVAFTEGRVRDSEGNLHTVAAGTTAAFGAAAANPRIDVVEVKTDGSEVKIKKGTESASPVVPAVDAGFVAIANVALAKEFTEVKAENVTDVRQLS